LDSKPTHRFFFAVFNLFWGRRCPLGLIMDIGASYQIAADQVSGLLAQLTNRAEEDLRVLQAEIEQITVQKINSLNILHKELEQQIRTVLVPRRAPGSRVLTPGCSKENDECDIFETDTERESRSEQSGFACSVGAVKEQAGSVRMPAPDDAHQTSTCCPVSNPTTDDLCGSSHHPIIVPAHTSEQACKMQVPAVEACRSDSLGPQNQQKPVNRNDEELRVLNSRDQRSVTKGYNSKTLDVLPGMLSQAVPAIRKQRRANTLNQNTLILPEDDFERTYMDTVPSDFELFAVATAPALPFVRWHDCKEDLLALTQNDLPPMDSTSCSGDSNMSGTFAPLYSGGLKAKLGRISCFQKCSKKANEPAQVRSDTVGIFNQKNPGNAKGHISEGVCKALSSALGSNPTATDACKAHVPIVAQTHDSEEWHQRPVVEPSRSDRPEPKQPQKPSDPVPTTLRRLTCARQSLMTQSAVCTSITADVLPEMVSPVAAPPGGVVMQAPCKLNAVTASVGTQSTETNFFISATAPDLPFLPWEIQKEKGTLTENDLALMGPEGASRD